MKRAAFLAFILIFFFSIQFVNAQEINLSPTVEPSAVPSLSEESVEYQLPYPGLLPDSSFYFLKVVRDKIISFLVSDPLKKADFDLLQADKRLSAGVYLFDRRKFNLASSTILKGENYFEEALVKAEEAKKQGMDTGNIGDRLLTAFLKHKIVVKGLEKKAPNENKAEFSSLVKRIEGFENRASELKTK
ncbi:MAG: hypothetical protein HYT83_00305 [Candidatus Levybacteria bacterium]|nr:hypothetical protein [Candidatus Levybacteria bacterium]